jgi:hypothetical protein
LKVVGEASAPIIVIDPAATNHAFGVWDNGTGDS